jgi:diguanylate cyclase (GGDEF)-like protein/PAS domain S-box-containing protein
MALLAGLAPAATAPVVDDDGDPLIVSQDHAWPPFAYRDESGEPRGLLIDFWQLIGAAMDRPVAFALTDWDDSLVQVRDGRAHVHGGLFSSPERETFLDFGVEIFPLRAALFAAAALPALEASDLSGTVVGVTRGGFEEEFLRENHPGLELKTYENNDLLVRAAARGEIAAFAADYPVGMYLLDRHASPERFRVLEVLYARKLRIAVARGETALLSEINAAITGLDANELSRITQKWMRSESVGTIPDWFWAGLPAGILTLLLGSLIIYSRLLKRQVKQHTRSLREANDALRAERDFSRSVLDASPGFFVALDEDQRIRMMNPAMLETLGYSAGEVIGGDFASLCLPAEEHESLRILLRHMGVSGKPVHHESQVLTRNGEKRLVEWHANLVKGASGQPEFFFAMGLDITERRRAEAQLEHIAHYDPLTGLANRTLLQARLDHALDLARRRDRRVAILFLDLNEFKQVNDSLGHACGDEVLRAVAERLHERVREEDTLARWGGDEFILLVEEVTDTGHIAALARDLLDRLAQPVTLSNGHRAHVGGSIGITLYPEDGNSPDTLITRADMAMYQAKEQGRSMYQFYSTTGPQEPADPNAS